MFDSAFNTSDSIQGDAPDDLALERQTEDVADNLLADCLTLKGAQKVNTAYDMNDGDLLPSIMCAIANWNGRSDSADATMKKLHNLLCNELHSVAQAIERGLYK